MQSVFIPSLACVHAVSLHTTFGLCSCSQSSYHLWLVFMQSVFIIIFGLCSFSHFSNHLSLAFIVILQTTFGLCSQTFSIPLFACVHSHSAYHFTLCSLSFFIPALACVHRVSLHTTFGLCSCSHSLTSSRHISPRNSPLGLRRGVGLQRTKFNLVFSFYTTDHHPVEEISVCVSQRAENPAVV